MFFNAPESAKLGLYLRSVGVGSTIDVLIPAAASLYLVEVKDNSSGYLGSAIIYVDGRNATIRVVFDGTTGGLMTGDLVPTLQTNKTGKCVVRFTNLNSARKVAVAAMTNYNINF
ncbi:hypothetical protein [Caudoviricetes sp.]|nr:hypothetical protein [Caudoviricetes sp.]